MSRPLHVTLYVKPDCPLCDELKADLAGLRAEIALEITERNIEADEEDFRRYRYLIPVLDIEGGELLYPPHHWDAVRGVLYSAWQKVQ